MYEELYRPLPDEEAYLKRLNIQKRNVCDEAYLDELVAAHQREIPFENLDVMRQRPVSLAVEQMFEKIIRQKRGGYCFELNSLFCHLLQELGFEAFGCRSRILRGKDYVPPVLHRGNLVRLEEGLYYCDVGYGGPQPGASIKVEDGYEKEIEGRIFRVRDADGYWWTLSRRMEGGWEEVMQFTIMPQTEVDFVPINFYCSTHPDSVFVKQYMLNKRLENGSISLVGDTFARTENGVRTEEKIPDRNRFLELVETEFKIPGADALV
ncbi:MAG: arylamine N-acetyltransferase family protein [Ruminococcus sp.]|jgi:N-hydroxyarylamine O-acetyltransferase